MRDLNSGSHGESEGAISKNTFHLKIYAAVFLVLAFGICISCIVPAMASFLSKRSNSANTDNAVWDGAAEYPFEESALAGMTPEPPAQEQSLFSTALVKVRSAVGRVRGIEDKLEDKVTQQHPLRMSFVLLNRAWSRYICGMNMTTALSGTEIAESESVVVERTDGSLAYIYEDADVTDTAQALIDFAGEMKEEGRNFLLFEAPVKSGHLSARYQAVVSDHTQERDKRVNAMLAENEISYVSCSEALEAEGIDWTSLFFKTDHHWLPQAGLWGCRVLAQALNDTAGYEIDTGIFDESNYEITWIPDSFLGSQGRKVTGVYASAEDFPIIMPRYESDLTVFHSSLNETLSGSIRDTMFDWSLLEETDLYNRNAYGFYGYGDEGLLRIHNNRLSDGRRILFVRVSMADCMAPFLSNAAEYVDFIDLRLFGGSLRTYIRETDPDTVAVIYPTSTFEAKNSRIFDFS